MRAAWLFALVGLWSGAAVSASPMDGLWLTDDHKGVVRIGACGGHTCGWTVRVLARGPNVPTHDVNNPDPNLRARAILGMPVLTGFGADGSGGRAYDPRSGRSYRATMSLNADGSLTVTGCLVLFLCQSNRWTRTR
jgi:uncharacterized protein (DUF2147 family)